MNPAGNGCAFQRSSSWNTRTITNGKDIPDGFFAARLGPQIANRVESVCIKARRWNLSKTRSARPIFGEGLTQAGYDCSGLIYRAFRETGTLIPRDAHEQWMKARRIKHAAALRPMDLIFSAKADHPKTITHVAMYVGHIDGHDDIIEAPQAGMPVRKIAFKEKYGQALKDTQSGDKIGDRVVYFGRFPTLRCRSSKPSTSSRCPSN